MLVCLTRQLFHDFTGVWFFDMLSDYAWSVISKFKPEKECIHGMLVFVIRVLRPTLSTFQNDIHGMFILMILYIKLNVHWGNDKRKIIKSTKQKSQFLFLHKYIVF